MIYLDNNATTAVDPRVVEVIAREMSAGPANPSSLHASGRRARSKIENAIALIGNSIGTRLDRPGGPRLILTSGGTEANNLALAGIGKPDGPIVISRIEHSSILAAARAHPNRPIRWLDVDSDGRVLVDQLLDRIRGTSNGGVGDDDAVPASLVSIMSANNETGVIQPIDQIASICRDAGVPLHVDATQSIGKLPFHVEELGISSATFTAHKFHGPAGIGGLWIAGGVEVRPMLFGGEQQLATRPGTESVALAMGMAEALRIATKESVRRQFTCKR